MIGDCITENISNNHKNNNSNGCADLSGYASNGIGCGGSSSIGAGYLSNNNNTENFCSLN